MRLSGEQTGQKEDEMCPACMCACTHRYRHRFAFQGSKEGRIKQKQPGAQEYWKKELSLDLMDGMPMVFLPSPLLLSPKEAQDLSQL